MKNLVISTSVLLLMTSLSLNTAFAQNKATQELHQAVVSGDVEKVKSLISEGADVNYKSRISWTPLHAAVRNRQKPIVELLIEKGADVNAKNDKGETPLHFSVDNGQKDIVELLITKGADVNVLSSSRDNALSLAKKKGHTEIADLLVKHGAKEPTLEDLQGDRYYGGGPVARPNYQMGVQTASTAATTAQSQAQLKVLDDPNEIKARVKTFKGLDKIVADVAGKSQNEVRQWQQDKYDNRTLLISSVQKQYEEELGSVRKVAVEEKTKKTTAAIDELLAKKQKRFKTIHKELLAQKRELRQVESSRIPGRGRSSGRGTRGRYSPRDQQSGDPLYDRGGGPPGADMSDGPDQPQEQLDRETQEEMRQWMQTTVDSRTELARNVHQQILAEIGSVRVVAVEEKAQKTTAAIDGLLLARQERFVKLTKEMEEEKRALQQAQAQAQRNREENIDQSQRPTQGGRNRRRRP